MSNDNQQKPPPPPTAEQIQQMRENQARMARIVQQKNKLVAEKSDERLATEIFANAKISDRWKDLASKCIMKTAPVHHSLLIPQFLMCLRTDPVKNDITLFQFGVLNNALENISPNEMGLSREEYVDLMENEVLPLMEIWKQRVKSIREEIILQVDAEFKVQMAMEMTKNKSSNNMATA